MIGITKKRLYKIKKIKNQSRKIPKRKHKRKRKKKQNKSFRRRRKYNLKNKSLKKYKGGGFFTFDEIMKLKPNAENAEIEQIHKAKLARLKEGAKRGEKVIIKQIIPVKGRQHEYGIMDMFFGKDLKLKDDFFSTKTPENLEQRNLKNKLLGLQLSITRKNMAPFKKPLYEIINSILLKKALDKNNDGPLYEYFKMPLYKKDGPNNVDERKKKDPFHDAGGSDSGSIELMKLLTANEWFKVMFTDPGRNYSVESMATASAVPGVIENGLTVLQNKEEVVNIPPPPGVAVGSPPTKVDDEDRLDIPTKDEESSGIETETDEDETIEEGNITSATEIAELEALLSNDKKLIDNYNEKSGFDDFGKDEAYDIFKEDIQQPPSLLTIEEIQNAVDEIDTDSFDDLYQDIQGDGEEYVTDTDDKKIQKNLGTMLMTDEETKLLGKEVNKSIDDRIKILSNINDKLPQDSTKPLEEPIPGIQEAMEESRRKSRERMDSIESKNSFDEGDEGLIRGPTPRPGTPLGKKIKGKIGSKLRDFADAANDPDTGMRARLGKLAPKKYVRLPPPDKPNVYFKATFRNDDWNLKLEKEGFAKDARSWLARVGIMSGGNFGEIESY